MCIESAMRELQGAGSDGTLPAPHQHSLAQRRRSETKRHADAASELIAVPGNAHDRVCGEVVD